MTEAQLQGVAGALHVRRWIPDGTLGDVALLHGLGEHGGRYEALAARLNAESWAVQALDLQGHGRSEGPRGLVRDFADYAGELDLFLRDLSASRPDRPLALFAHSMGALVALDWLRRYPENLRPRLDALVLSATALRFSMRIPAVKKMASGLLAALAPRLTLDNELRYPQLTRDPEEERIVRADPLYHRRIGPRLFLGFVAAQRAVLGDAPSFPAPVLVLHGTEDPIIDVESSRWLKAHLRAPRIESRFYEGSRHEVLHDLERERAREDIATFLRAPMNTSTTLAAR